MNASFCVAKEAASVLPNKRLQNSEDFRRHKLHFSTFLFVRYVGSRHAERGIRRGHCPGTRGHRGARGSELSR